MLILFILKERFDVFEGMALVKIVDWIDEQIIGIQVNYVCSMVMSWYYQERRMILGLIGVMFKYNGEIGSSSNDGGVIDSNRSVNHTLLQGTIHITKDDESWMVEMDGILIKDYWIKDGIEWMNKIDHFNDW
jgi:hypothetical protein